jgi:uncharacterized protein YidB (DUF937 family)
MQKMDVLDKVKSAIGSVVGNKQNEIMPIIINLISEQSGGLSGLIQKFTSKGLGNIATSWVGTGKNLPISPAQIQDVLGADTIKNMSSKLGMDTNTVTKQLSNLLPEAVNTLTPDGKILEGDVLKKKLDMLGALKGSKF